MRRPLSEAERRRLPERRGACVDESNTIEIIRLAGEAQGARIPIAMIIAAPQFLRLVRYAGLAAAFKIFEDRGEALTYLSECAGR